MEGQEGPGRFHHTVTRVVVLKLSEAVRSVVAAGFERTVRGPHPDPWDARFGVTR